MLIYAGSGYQAYLKKIREVDPNMYWLIYSMILDVLIQLQKMRNINYVEMYGFALHLPDFDISNAVGLDYVVMKSLKLTIGYVINRLSAWQLELESSPNMERLKKGDGRCIRDIETTTKNLS